MQKERKFLITGGSGTLGTYISKMLENYGEVEIFDKELKDGLKGREGDIRKENEVVDAVEGKDVVLHLASLTDLHECEENSESCFEVNVKGTYNVCKAAIREDVKLIFFSSREVYGDSKRASEKSALNPNNTYGMSKVAAEEIVRQMVENKLILRPSNVFGTGEDVVSTFSSKINNKKEAPIYPNIRLDLIYIEDLIDMLELMISKRLEGTFNLGSGQSFTTEEICDVIEDEVNKNVEKEEMKPESTLTKQFSMSIEKLKSNLDYKIPNQEDRIRMVAQNGG